MFIWDFRVGESDFNIQGQSDIRISGIAGYYLVCM